MCKLALSLSTVAVSLSFAASGSVSAQQPGTTGPTIELRLARETPAPGFTYLSAVYADTGFYVEERSIVSDEYIEIADVVRRGNDLLVDIRLTLEGASRLAGATSESIGGLLAVLLDSRLVSVAQIFSPIGVTSSRTVNTGGLDLPAEVADEIEAALASRWPERSPGQ